MILGSPPRVRGKPVHIERSGRRGRITPARAGKTVTAANGTANQTDHPRACGENLHALTCLAIRTGSPPRVRGKHDRHKGRYPSSGITPARAGKTTGRTRASAGRRGSPPRVRGKLGIDVHPGRYARITPARAGKTQTQAWRPQKRRDHPRACGENPPLPAKGAGSLGSPPRVRGKPARIQGSRSAHRITPARAGKTSPPNEMTFAATDHPRACGENITSRNKSIPPSGSPPRVRGYGHRLLGPPSLQGITPARAGKTVAQRQFTTPQWDHPRACGENAYSQAVRQCRQGSPPRVRGKLYSSVASVATMGITPARAGKTTARGIPAADAADHPRACGENGTIQIQNDAITGSPPRVRGKQILQRRRALLPRITPARAGKTG